MTELTLLDAAVLVFIVFSVVRGRSRTLGDSLHGLGQVYRVIRAAPTDFIKSSSSEVEESSERPR
mgnify:CR=1 FL=1